MSCHGRPHDAVPTLKDLIHEMSAEWTHADQPVYVDVYDTEGNLTNCPVTGITVTARGQTLDFRWPWQDGKDGKDD